MGEQSAVRAAHLLVSGSGRAGTSFLINWLHACGLDTGVRDGVWFPDARAGHEHAVGEAPGQPYVLKDPSLHEYLEVALATGALTIDGLIIPIRNLEDAAASRIVQERAAIAADTPQRAGWSSAASAPGGVLFSLDVGDQRDVLARGLARLLDIASRHAIPVAMPHFPELVEDFDHLWAAVGPMVEGQVDVQTARRAFMETADPGLVRIAGRAGEGPVTSDTEQDVLVTELGRRLQEARRLLLQVQHDLAMAKGREKVLDLEVARLEEERRASAVRQDDAHATLEAAAAGLRAQLDALVGSRSWRITKPLRTTFGDG